MRNRLAVTLIAAATLACSGEKRYDLEGQVLVIDRSRQEMTVRHEDVKGFMPAMTMPFKVGNAAALDAAKPGDLIKATLVVSHSTGRLESIVRTGVAPLPADMPPSAPPTLEVGGMTPEAELVDSEGRQRLLSEWRGRTIAVTFVYTRCPIPDFCPLMDKHFAAVQRTVETDAQLAARVRLLSVSFDPDYDTPEVLRAHARRVGANPSIWTWLTGSKEAVDKFGAHFGVSMIRDDRPLQEIVHNLQTAVIAPDGRLRRIFNGNEWTPEQLLAELRAADAR